MCGFGSYANHLAHTNINLTIRPLKLTGLLKKSVTKPCSACKNDLFLLNSKHYTFTHINNTVLSLDGLLSLLIESQTIEQHL